MKKTAPVSVIVPCFNCSETLERAVASVALQTVLPIEVILIDDASSDGGRTVQSIRRLMVEFEDFFTIKFVELIVNGGAASARNAGWAIASQPYIALLDSDDSWLHSKIEYQYGYMLLHSDVSLCAHGYIDSCDVSINNLVDDDLAFGRPISSRELLFSNPFVTPSVMLRSDINFKFSHGKRYVDDHLLWLEISLSGLLVVKLPAKLVVIHKPLFGASGLSSHMVAMEISELNNYFILFEENKISLPAFVFFTIYSLLKFFRRLLIILFRLK